MKRQKERRKRERDEAPAFLQRLLQVARSNYVGEVDPLPNTFVPAFLDKFAVGGRIEGELLMALCSDIGCTPADVSRACSAVPRAASSADVIFQTELAFVALKLAAPVDVKERRMQSSTGDVDEHAPLMQFYRANLPMDETEWALLVRSLSTPLPMTFRVHLSEPALHSVARHCLTHEPIAPVVSPHPLFKPTSCVGMSALDVFACNHDAYHANSSTQLAVRNLHAGAAGSFQEIVSMLPVAVLPLTSASCVLDMCAAPGSKSLQALDQIQQCDWRNLRSSLVILNEKDRTKATQTLPARIKRYHAPNVIITRCDGTQLPRLYFASTLEQKRFDCIICDVPCSGDGTIRKERSVVQTWSTQYVESLTHTQRALLKRAVDLLEIGGVVVYSTCSMNPAEDEQVICHAMQVFGASVELVNVNEALLRAGVVGLRSAGGVAVDGAPPEFKPSNVLRVLPHRDDTGGFFVAALRKVSIPPMSQPAVSSLKLNQWTNRSRWAAVPRGDPHWRSIMEFYGISRESEDEMLVHFAPLFHVNPNGGPQRRIVFATPRVAETLVEVRAFKGPGVELVSVGARAFEAYDGTYLSECPCRWRAVYECASRVAFFATKRKLLLSVDVPRHGDIATTLLREGSIALSEAVARLLFVERDWWQDADRPSDAAGFAAEAMLQLGPVLIGLQGGPMKLAGASTWWLSATLTARKLEIAVDESLCNLAVMALFPSAAKALPDSDALVGQDGCSVEMDEED